MLRLLGEVPDLVVAVGAAALVGRDAVAAVAVQPEQRAERTELRQTFASVNGDETCKAEGCRVSYLEPADDQVLELRVGRSSAVVCMATTFRLARRPSANKSRKC